MVTQRLATALSILFLILHVSCKEKIVGPEFKDPRTYTWTIDTLAYPGSFQTSMRDIWASSPTDVYVVGHNDRAFGKMWHYNGKDWKSVKLHILEGGPFANIGSLSGIQGFGPNAVVAVGNRTYYNPTPPPNFLDSSLIIRFDGQKWTEERTPQGRGLWSISASAPNDMWTGGSNATLYHYNGISWERDSILFSVPSDGEGGFTNISVKSQSEVFALGIVHQNALIRTTFYFYRRSNGHWNLVESFFVQPGQSEVKFGTFGLWLSPRGTLYSFTPDILRWTGTSWVKVFETFDALRRMAGTSDENIFAVGDFGRVLHYNGVDWYEYKELKNPNVVYSSVWTDGREVFVVGYLNDGTKSIVLHGK